MHYMLVEDRGVWGKMEPITELISEKAILIAWGAILVLMGMNIGIYIAGCLG